MNQYLFFTLVFLILILSIFIGNRSSKNLNNQFDYFLSDKKFNLLLVCMTLFATQFGGGAIIGGAEASYTYGWVAIFYSVGIALGLITLSQGVGTKFKQLNVSTIPEIFEKVYGSKNLRLFASFLYIISMFLILIATGVSARKFAHAIGFYNDIIFVIFWLIIIGYTTKGGLNTVIKTDVLQIAFVIIAFTITAISLLFADIKYFVSPSELPVQNLPWLSWILFPCLFTITGQDMAQRCFAAKNNNIVSNSTLLASIMLIIASILPTYLGIIAYKTGFQSIDSSSVLINIVSQLTNPYVASIFAAAILMAILLTADSLICAISSNISLDIFKEKTNTRNYEYTIKKAKIITLVIGLCGMICSFFVDKIISLMIMAYELSMCALFVPIIMSIFDKKYVLKQAAIFSSISGFISYLILKISFNNFDYNGVIALLISLIMFFIPIYSKDKNPKIK